MPQPVSATSAASATNAALRAMGLDLLEPREDALRAVDVLLGALVVRSDQERVAPRRQGLLEVLFLEVVLALLVQHGYARRELGAQRDELALRARVLRVDLERGDVLLQRAVGIAGVLRLLPRAEVPLGQDLLRRHRGRRRRPLGDDALARPLPVLLGDLLVVALDVRQVAERGLVVGLELERARERGARA